MTTPRLKTDGEDARTVSRIVNRILDGAINSVGSVTLSTGTTTTLVSDFRANTSSKVFLTPTTANAAAEVPTLWVTAAAQSFTVNHSSATTTDRSFGYAVLG